MKLRNSIVSSYSQTFFKKGGAKKKLDSLVEILETLKNKNVLIGLLAFSELHPHMIALKGTQLPIVVPIFSSSFIFVTLISAHDLKERVSIIRWAGILRYSSA